MPNKQKVMKKLLIIVIFSVLTLSISAQKQHKLQINGYFSQMSQTIIDSFKGTWLNDQITQNRLKIAYAPTSFLSFDVEARTRLQYGATIQMTPNIAQAIGQDRGFFDMSYNLFSGNSAILNTNIDRAYVQIEASKFKAVIGRQRINWGMTFVWNPNDWFNNYSFFDFDYAEKPGSDAINIQFFPTYSSSIDFVTKVNSDTLITSALRYKFNLFNYDFQVLGGIINSNDFSIGVGWSGSLGNTTFRGEATYLHPRKNFADTNGVFLCSVGFDYMFENSLTIVGEFLYNQSAKNPQITGLFAIQQAPVDVKSLSIAPYNAVLQVSYPINPIINASSAAMWMSYNNWFFLSPNVTFALNNDVDFAIISQTFLGKFYNPVTSTNDKKIINLIYFRIKYDF